MASSTNPDLASSHLGIIPSRAGKLIPTAEHLQARSDGGENTPTNIVAAHQECNQRRHRMRPPPPPESFLRIARAQVEQGTWFEAPILRRLIEVKQELSRS
ncbi:HNH endonuclease [Hydrogenophaga sp. XSHU_21]